MTNLGFKSGLALQVMLLTTMLFPFPNNSYHYCHNDYSICMGPGLHKLQGQASVMSKLLKYQFWLHLIDVLSFSRTEPMAGLVFPREVLTENEYMPIWLIDRDIALSVADSSLDFPRISAIN